MRSPSARKVKIIFRRNLVIGLFLLNVPLLCYIYYRLNLVNYAWYNRSQRSSLHCRTSDENMNALLKLSRDIHDILTALNITHWLAYGSLWGALRYGAPLPWDTDLDMGLLGGELERVPKDVLTQQLQSRNISLRYSSWGGYYRVTRGEARADLMIFDSFSDDAIMERVGLEAYICFINYRKMHVFPAKLIRKPLPSLPFGEVDMPVPRDGLEVQKYHYPYDWWKESKPVGC